MAYCQLLVDDPRQGGSDYADLAMELASRTENLKRAEARLAWRQNLLDELGANSDCVDMATSLTAQQAARPFRQGPGTVQ